MTAAAGNASQIGNSNTLTKQTHSSQHGRASAANVMRCLQSIATLLLAVPGDSLWAGTVRTILVECLNLVTSAYALACIATARPQFTPGLRSAAHEIAPGWVQFTRFHSTLRIDQKGRLVYPPISSEISGGGRPGHQPLGLSSVDVGTRLETEAHVVSCSLLVHCVCRSLRKPINDGYHQHHSSTRYSTSTALVALPRVAFTTGGLGLGVAVLECQKRRTLVQKYNSGVEFKGCVKFGWGVYNGFAANTIAQRSDTQGRLHGKQKAWYDTFGSTRFRMVQRGP
jgi:hypothetical protein